MRRERDKTTRTSPGWAVVEALMGVAIMGLVAAGLARSVIAAGAINRHHLVRQRCIAAASAQLDSLSAVGKPLPEAGFRRLWPGLRCRLAAVPGKGDWAGLILHTAVVTGTSRGRPVTVTLARYAPPGKEAP